MRGDWCRENNALDLAVLQETVQVLGAADARISPYKLGWCGGVRVTDGLDVNTLDLHRAAH